MFPISQSSLADVAVQNQNLPSGGPKAVPVTLDFGVNSGFGNASWSLNLQNSQALARFSNLQTLFVDNSRNTQVLSVTIGGTRQTIKVKPGYQGYYPVMASNPILLQFDVDATNADDAAVVTLLNVPMAPAEWGALAVSQTEMRVLTDGDANSPLIAATVPLAVPGITVDVNNFVGTNGTPSKLYLAAFHLMMTPDATFSAPIAGALTKILVRIIANTGGELYRTWMQAGDEKQNAPGFLFLSIPGDDLNIALSDMAGAEAATIDTGSLNVNITYATGLFA